MIVRLPTASLLPPPRLFSVRFTGASGQAIRRTASLMDDSTFSTSLWFYRTTDTGAPETVCQLRQAEAGGNPAVGLSINSADVLQITAGAGGATADLVNPFPTGVWYWIAVTSDATTITGYAAVLNGPVTIVTCAAQAMTSGVLCYGDRFLSGGETVNGRVAAVKAWSLTLTQAEMLSERFQYVPKTLRDLYSFMPFGISPSLTGQDFGPRKLDYTVSGTLSLDAPPPIPWEVGIRRQIWDVPSIVGGTATTPAFPYPFQFVGRQPRPRRPNYRG